MLAACVDAGVDPPPAQGEMLDEGEPADSAPERGGPNASGAGEPEVESPSLDTILGVTDPASAPDGVSAADRVRRLTQWELTRSASDLLGIDAEPSTRNLPDELPTLDGYFAADSLSMTDRLVAELAGAAEEMTDRFLADADAYEAAVGCTAADAACRDQFLQSFGARAYRRPLSDSELERYRSLFDEGAALVGSGDAFRDAFRDGVRVAVEAFLQSPNFLFRIERGNGEVDDQGELLSGYEVAARLSFLFWGSVPDAALLDAARRGELTSAEGVAREAERLVADPRVVARVQDYHQRWLQLEALSSGDKDAEAFPAYTNDLVRSMMQETSAFVRAVTLDEPGGVRELFTAPVAFVDQGLADLYGLDMEVVEGDGLERVELDAEGERGGILTQAAFLSGHSSSSNRTSPILRGVFVLRRLLCQDIPDPPPNAQSTEPPPSPTPINTTREFFAWKTSMAQCSGCHGLINPIGFGFEDFDAIGRHRTEEAGKPVDASGDVRIGGQALRFEGGRELALALAEMPEVHACYAKNWLRYLWGRVDTEQDLRTLATVRLGMGAGGYGVRDLLLDVSRSAAFRHIRPAVGESPEAESLEAR